MKTVALDDLVEDGGLNFFRQDPLLDVDVAHHVDGADAGHGRDPPVGVVGDDELAEAVAAEGAHQAEGFFVVAGLAFVEVGVVGGGLAGAVGDVGPVEDGGIHFRGGEIFVAAPVDVGIGLGRVPYSALDGAVEGFFVVELIVVDDEELVESDFLLWLVGCTCESSGVEREEEEV